MSELNLQKLKSEFRDGKSVLYFIENSNSEYIKLNDLIGLQVKLEFTGQINCVHCDRKTKKSFAQGHCFPCFRSLASCDMCVMKPETCHYSAGTCREPQWGEENCFKTHTVYLANSSGLKVGVTRGSNPMTRWIDQGAVQGIPLVTVSDRLDAGKVEVALKSKVADKTNWRVMLKGDIPEVDLHQARADLLPFVPQDLNSTPSEMQAIKIEYPVEVYPEKIKSFNLDKNPLIEGILQGIKGQYLIFDTGVINVRKYSGYRVTLDWH